MQNRVERPDIGYEGLRPVNPEAEKAGRMAAAEVDNMIAEPKYGFMVQENERSNPDFWSGVSRALKNRSSEVGDVSQLVQSIDQAVARGGTIDGGQLAREINAFFQQ